MSLLTDFALELPVVAGGRRAARTWRTEGAVVDDESAHGGSGIESALFSALLDQPRLGVGICDRHGVLTTVNHALQSMLGDPRPAANGSALSHFGVHREDGRPMEAGHDPLARALSGETVSDEAVTVRSPGAPTRFLRCSAFRLQGPQGQVVGAVLLAADITDRVVEASAHEALTDQLVEAVNHEVRTPLSVIVGHMELIRDQQGGELPAGMAWSLGAIGRAASDLSAAVDDLSGIADRAERRAAETPRNGEAAGR